MTNKQYKKLGALFRAPIIKTAEVLAVTLAVIGMVTYVGLYNPRAGLESAKSPPPRNTARAAPASKPGDSNSGSKVGTLKAVHSAKTVKPVKIVQTIETPKMAKTITMVKTLDLSMLFSSQNYDGVAASDNSPSTRYPALGTGKNIATVMDPRVVVNGYKMSHP